LEPSSDRTIILSDILSTGFIRTLRLIQVHLGEVGEVHPIEQETVDAELQVLVRAIGRVAPGRRAGPCRPAFLRAVSAGRSAVVWRLWSFAGRFGTMIPE